MRERDAAEIDSKVFESIVNGELLLISRHSLERRALQSIPRLTIELSPLIVAAIYFPTLSLRVRGVVARQVPLCESTRHRPSPNPIRKYLFRQIRPFSLPIIQ